MKILVAGTLTESAVTRLRQRHELVMAVGARPDRIANLIGDCDALIFRSGVEITADVLRKASALRLVIRAGSGYDNIDLDELANMRLRVVRIPGPGAKAVAELAFTMMLALSRQLIWADREWRTGNWVKPQAVGHLLTGRSLGIVGAGNIGARTGELGSHWGMNVSGCVEFPTDAIRERLASRGIELTDFESVMANSDYVSVHVPLTAATQGLIDASAIARMRRGAYLVNLSRGGVVDEAALRNALLDGHLAGAGLDVHAAEGDGKVSSLADLDNVVLTPHIGASAIEAQEEIGRLAVEAADRGVAPGDLLPGTPDNFVVI